MSIREVAARAGVSADRVARVHPARRGGRRDTDRRVDGGREGDAPDPASRRPFAGPRPDRQRSASSSPNRERLLRRDHQGGPGRGAPRGLPHRPSSGLMSRQTMSSGGRERWRPRSTGCCSFAVDARRRAARLGRDGAGRADRPPGRRHRRRLWWTPRRRSDTPWSICTPWDTGGSFYLGGPSASYSNEIRRAATGMPARGWGWTPTELGPVPTPGSRRVSARPTSSSRAVPRPCWPTTTRWPSVSSIDSSTAASGCPMTSASSALTTPPSRRWSPPADHRAVACDAVGQAAVRMLFETSPPATRSDAARRLHADLSTSLEHRTRARHDRRGCGQRGT